ncbi:energy transducer TonB [Flavobacteriales bacterium]|nr:energy transducer TonB [Flavobacteriales bacterium]MDB2675120.1 energy transducer TonB [Flavobacteriales bacterium]
MDPKKNPKVDLEKKRGLFMQIGLAVSLLIVLGAFEYRTYEKVVSSLGDLILEADFEEEIENTFREEKPPPPPPPPPDEIVIVENEEEIEETEIEDTESDEDLEVIEEEEETTDEVFMVVEDMPRFEGCSDEACTQNKIMQFIGRKTKYPPIAKENNITGRVYVSFVVDKSGSVTDVKILRGVDKYLDAEAVRVVKSLPKFSPGKQRGKPVKVQYNVPISFRLN